MEAFKKYIEKLDELELEEMYENDFSLTQEEARDELEAAFTVTNILRYLGESNISTKVFDSSLGISLFRDDSARMRLSSASVRNLSGLGIQDLNEGKSQISHGEIVREAANMISFMANIIGIRDNIYIGKGNVYMHEVSESVQEEYKDRVLKQRPTLANLQCDIDHPTQITADTLHLIHEFGGTENLRGKKVVMTWAYSPSYGKPLSIPQGIVGLMTRLGMDIVLTCPEGCEIMPKVKEVAKKNVAEFDGNFTKADSTTEASKDADIVYPKSWTPFAAIEKRTELYSNGDQVGTDQSEQELLSQNKKHKDWEYIEELTKTTKDNKALYMHYLPADITGINCEKDEVEASAFDRYRIELYKEASYKPYVIAAMIFLSKVKNPQKTLTNPADKVTSREAKW